MWFDYLAYYGKFTYDDADFDIQGDEILTGALPLGKDPGNKISPATTPLIF